MRPSATMSPHALRVSGDRWLFGYADVVTLLFACFATLYAATLEPVPTRAAAPSPETVPATEHLRALLDDALTLPGVDTTASVRGYVISLPEAGSFAAGSADLSDRAAEAIRELAVRLATVPNQIRVEGHTDDVPIATADFQSNWELSTARATRVVELLIEEGLGPGRLSAAGYGEYRPRLPNGSAETRARNRRVDIVVLDPDIAVREEPGAMTR